MRALERRVPPPFLFLSFAAAMGFAAVWLEPADIVGRVRWPLVALFVLLALVGPLGILQFSRAKTTIDPVNIDDASTLVTSGVFGLTRNPMYLGMTCLLIAETFYLSVPWAWLGPVLFLLFITRFQVVPEERAMATKFGAEYAAYRSRVRRWI